MRKLALDDPRTWLIASARYFQGLGFYMDYLDLPDEALLEAIREAFPRTPVNRNERKG